MSEHPTLPGLWPIHGDGVLARQGDLVLLIHPAGGAFTDRLLDLLANAAGTGGGGRRFADLISAEFDSAAAAIDSTSDEPGPAAVAFGPDGSGTAVAVCGAAWAEVTTAHGTQRLTPGQPYGRLRCVLPSRAIKIRAGVHAECGDASTDRYLRLADGVVRAIALVYAPEEATAAETAGPEEAAAAEEAAGPEEPAAAEEPATAEEPAAPEQPAVPDDAGPAEPAVREELAATASAGTAEEPAGPQEPAALGDVAAAEPARQDEPAVSGPPRQDFISVSLAVDRGDVDVPRRPALPLGSQPAEDEDLGAAGRLPPAVLGVYCKNGHFDDPEARYCAVCGIGMAQLTKVPQAGQRPPLGVLVLDDGSVFQLDADYVLGREPSLDSSVADGSARPLRLADASGLVSRIHARVELDGWQVFVCDLNSANGTRIRLPGEKDSKQLEPGVRAALAVGADVRLGGDYGFRYDSHRHR